MAGTLALQSGRLELESIVRAPLVVIADPVVAASGPRVTLDDLGGDAVRLLGRPAGTILALTNPTGGVGPVRVGGAPDVVAAWGSDADTGDGSPVRARMHRGRTRLGLIVVTSSPPGDTTVTTGAGAAAVIFTAPQGQAVQLPLAG